MRGAQAFCTLSLLFTYLKFHKGRWNRLTKEMKEKVKEEVKEKEEIIEEAENKAEVQEGQDVEENVETAESDLEANQEVLEEQREDNQLEVLMSKIKEKEEENADLMNRMQRLQADFINYKKRVEKEKSDIYLFGSEKLALDLLGIMDNLERAIDSQEEMKESGLYQGVELILKQLKDTFKKHGIEEIDALDKPFDVNLHHAVMHEESESESGTVIEVFQKGYTIHGKVLRPAMVKVSK